MTTMTTTTDRSGLEVWVGCVGCYNEGRLVGEWVAAEDAETITIETLHTATTHHEELWCYDVDNVPIGGEMSPMAAAQWGQCFLEVPRQERGALAAWVESGSYVAQADGQLPAVSDFHERYAGQWDSWGEFADNWIAETCLFDHWPQQAIDYFDHEKFARDLRFDFIVEDAPGGGVFVFHTL